MKTKLLLVIFCGLISLQVSAQRKKKANNETSEFRYEASSTVGQAAQGFTLLKVFTYSKSKNVPLIQSGKNAVHAVLFKGTADYNDGAIRIKGQRPLVSSVTAYDENEKFFTEFFRDGGMYQRYVQVVNNGIPDVGDVVKVGKEYKIGVKVLVNKEGLRKAMEEAGIIRALGGVF